MLPMICTNCQKTHSNNPGITGIYHGRDYESRCPYCNAVGEPASIVHLAIPCPSEESHPLLKGGKTTFAGEVPPHKIGCGYGPRLPRHLTSSPNAATCYQCLKVYRQMVSEPVESESL